MNVAPARLHVGLALGLRGATLAGRFGLVIALAAIASADVVGSFGLYSSALILSYSLMGMDVYAATTRELLADEGNVQSLKKHFGFVLVTYAIFLPIVMMASFKSGAVSGIILIIFAAHLAFEYYSQEFGRLMVVVGMPLASTFTLFVRSTLWIPVALLLIWRIPEADPMMTLVGCWLGGSVLSALVVVFFLRRLAAGVVAPLFDMAWLRRAIRASLLFFAGTLLFRALMNGDKFVVNNLLSRDLLGVYTVYASVGMGLLAMAETGISAWLYPGLVNAIQNKDWVRVRSLLPNFRNRMAIGAVAGGLVLVVAIPILLQWIGKSEYTNDLSTFYFILSGACLYCVSMPYHYVIYGFRKDGAFLAIYSMTLLAMLAFGFSTMPKFGLLGAGAMLGGALAFIALIRYVVAVRLIARTVATIS